MNCAYQVVVLSQNAAVPWNTVELSIPESDFFLFPEIVDIECITNINKILL